MFKPPSPRPRTRDDSIIRNIGVPCLLGWVKYNSAALMGTRKDEPTVPTSRIDNDELRSPAVVMPEGSAEGEATVVFDMLPAGGEGRPESAAFFCCFYRSGIPNAKRRASVQCLRDVQDAYAIKLLVDWAEWKKRQGTRC